MPPKTFLKTSENIFNGIEAKRQKLSLNLKGILETDLDNCSPPPKNKFSDESRPNSKSPERKISQDISAKVSKFEALAQAQSSGDTDSGGTKNLWFYRDGLRTPTTPTPVSNKLTVYESEDTFGQDMAPVVCPPELMTQSVTRLDQGPSTDTDTETLMSRSMISINSQNNINNSSPNNNAAPNSFYNLDDNTPPAVPYKARTLSKTRNGSGMSNLSMPNLKPHASKPPPPPLPPKHSKEKSPPSRPVSKELKLEDILLLCAEYEKQIEAEKKESLTQSPCPYPLNDAEQKKSDPTSTLALNDSYNGPQTPLTPGKD